MSENNSTETTQSTTREYQGTSSRRERDGRDGPAPVEVVLRRFFRDVQQSEIMTEIKRRRHFEKSPSRNARRAAAHGKETRRRARRGY